MATARQLALPWASEILSHLRKFLRLFRGGDVHDREEISNASAVRKGERYFTHAVHRVLHPRVHPVNPLTNLHTNHLTMPHCAFWSWRGRGVGWNDPAFCRTVRPKGFSGSFQPTRSRERHVLESEMKCMTQPRVRTCNREAALL